MGVMLDKVDRAVDVEFIIMQKAVEALVDVLKPYHPANPMGQDVIPTDNPGFYTLAAALYKEITDQVRLDTAGQDALIAEWHETQDNKLALGEGKTVVLEQEM